tara:strand:+ start:42 stop:371 length:330 start_codon:yes stop_codon:yes gene_type:complete
MNNVNTLNARTDSVVAAMKRLTSDALRFDGASKEGIKVFVQCNRCDSGASVTTTTVMDEDAVYGGHVTADVSHWWSSLLPAQRAWVKDNGRLFHCHGRLSGVEIVVSVD